MNFYQTARILLLGILGLFAIASGTFSFYYNRHLHAMKKLEFSEAQNRSKAALALRLQESFEKGFQDLLQDSQRILIQSNDQFSKGLKIIEASKNEVRHAFYVSQEKIYLPQWQKFRILKLREQVSMQIAEKPNFKLAEILEYQDNDFEAAVKLYEDFWLKNPDDFEAANALARCLYKMKQWERAEKIYQHIYSQNPPLQIQGDIPLALTSALQMLNIYQLQNQLQRLQAFGLEVYENLINEKWELSKDKNDYFKNKIRGFIQEFTGQPAYQRLQAQEKIIESYKSYVNIISDQVLPLLENKSLHNFQIYTFPSPDMLENFLFVFPFQQGHIILDLNFPQFLKKHFFIEFLALSSEYPQIGLRLNYGQNELFAQPSAAPGQGYSFMLSRHIPDLMMEVILPLDSKGLKKSQQVQSWYFLGGFTGFLMILMLFGFLVLKQLQLAELKSDFISHVSHELKTPLTSLRMFSELLLRPRLLSSGKRRKYYTIMHEETLRLARLIENLLDLSRIEQKKTHCHFTLENVDMVLKNAADIFVTASRSGGNRLYTRLQTPVQTLLDKDAITQMILNLLDNARKFSRPGQPIRLNSYCQGDKVVIEVKDTGVGMTRSETRKVFKKFYQVKRTYEDHFKGIGLGLTIVRNIVTSHGGHLVLESEKNQGTRVRAFLPRKG